MDFPISHQKGVIILIHVPVALDRLQPGRLSLRVSTMVPRSCFPEFLRRVALYCHVRLNIHACSLNRSIAFIMFQRRWQMVAYIIFITLKWPGRWAPELTLIQFKPLRSTEGYRDITANSVNHELDANLLWHYIFFCAVAHTASLGMYWGRHARRRYGRR